jgi:hypothetical protein
MINNKNLSNDPTYYPDWDIFEVKFPKEAIFICGEFAKICGTQSIIYGKSTVMTILNKIIPDNFPNLIRDFENVFPTKKIEAILGIGLWKTVDSDTNSWKWKKNYNEKKYIKI